MHERFFHGTTRLCTRKPRLPGCFLRPPSPVPWGCWPPSVYQLIDGMLVGQILGSTAFAALNLAMPFVIINFALADLIGVGSSVSISIGWEKRMRRRRETFFTCACLMILGAAFFIGALLFAGAPLFMRLMGAEGELAAQAVQYPAGIRSVLPSDHHPLRRG